MYKSPLWLYGQTKESPIFCLKDITEEAFVTEGIDFQRWMCQKNKMFCILIERRRAGRWGGGEVLAAQASGCRVGVGLDKVGLVGLDWGWSGARVRLEWGLSGIRVEGAKVMLEWG